MSPSSKALYFLTSNLSKFEEVKAVLPDVQMLNCDLLEIQEIDPKVIIQEKLAEAFQHHQGRFIVEDTSLILNALNGLPGPLIKWFQVSIGNAGLVNIAKALNNNEAEAITYVGYAKSPQEVFFFEGRLKGHIVPERGKKGFGWDTIFQPEGHSSTFAEMDAALKNALSMRRIALEHLKLFIESDRA